MPNIVEVNYSQTGESTIDYNKTEIKAIKVYEYNEKKLYEIPDDEEIVLIGKDENNIVNETTQLSFDFQINTKTYD